MSVMYLFCVILCCVQFSGSSLLYISTSTPALPTENSIPLGTTIKSIGTEITEKTRYEHGLEDYDEAQASMRQSRGMMMMMNDMDYHDHHSMSYNHDHKEKEEQKAVQADPWAGYYDFIINEGSFKFWAVFQLITAALLIYSAFAAVYYAKFNVITTDYDYYDDFLGRSNSDLAPSTNFWSGLSSQTFQRILDAISSKKYT